MSVTRTKSRPWPARGRPAGVKEIVATFGAKCLRCQGTVHRGQRAWWRPADKGGGMVHADDGDCRHGEQPCSS